MGKLWRRRLICVGLTIIVIYLAHPVLLEWAAGWLVASEQRPEQIDCLVLLSGDERYHVAGSIHENSPGLKVLVLQGPLDRLNRWKVTVPSSIRDRNALNAVGIPSEQIEILNFANRSEWEWARELHQWMRDHPEQRVGILCDEFSSGLTQQVLESTRNETGSSLQLLAVSDEQYTTTNWWKSRRGLKSFWRAYFDLIYATLFGEDTPAELEWTPDQYEQELEGR